MPLVIIGTGNFRWLLYTTHEYRHTKLTQKQNKKLQRALNMTKTTQGQTIFIEVPEAVLIIVHKPDLERGRAF